MPFQLVRFDHRPLSLSEKQADHGECAFFQDRELAEFLPKEVAKQIDYGGLQALLDQEMVAIPPEEVESWVQPFCL